MPSSVDLHLLQALVEGEEAVISYLGGAPNKSNLQMMKNYGFILPGNPHDTLPFAAGRPCAAAGSWNGNLLLLLPLPTQPMTH